MGNQQAQTTPSPMDATGQEEVEGDEGEVGVEETMATFLGRRGGRETHFGGRGTMDLNKLKTWIFLKKF